ncbi:MAG: helix-turn-helix transcriptional regulator [Sinorhizobium meliloti]|nr:helix-turn-helix transcriptional regulator [Sinorhizobium meliloti]
MPDDLAEVANMIARLEQSGLSRRAIAEGAGIGASQITRIMAGEARNPTLRVINSLKRFYRETLPVDEVDQPSPQQRFANGCQPRAGR